MGFENFLAVPAEAQKTIDAYKTLATDSRDTVAAVTGTATEVSHASVIDGLGDTWLVLGGTALVSIIGYLLYRIEPKKKA